MKKAAFFLLLLGLSTFQMDLPALGGMGVEAAYGGQKVWVIGTDDGVYSHGGNLWQEYPGKGKGTAISVASDGTPFVIGADKGIYRGTGSGWMELSGAGKGKDIALY